VGRGLLILALLGAAAMLTGRAGRGNGQDGLRGWPWLIAGLGLQLVWLRFLSLQVATPIPLHWLPVLALLSALWFLWLNRRYRGLWVLAAGAGLNVLVMASNGGLMPISPTSLRAIGAASLHTGAAIALSKDRLLGDNATHLAFLDDRLVVAAVGLRASYSLGDLLVLAGCLATLGEELWRYTGNRAVRVRQVEYGGPHSVKGAV